MMHTDLNTDHYIVMQAFISVAEIIIIVDPDSLVPQTSDSGDLSIAGMAQV